MHIQATTQREVKTNHARNEYNLQRLEHSSHALLLLMCLMLERPPPRIECLIQMLMWVFEVNLFQRAGKGGRTWSLQDPPKNQMAQAPFCFANSAAQA